MILVHPKLKYIFLVYLTLFHVTPVANLFGLELMYKPDTKRSQKRLKATNFKKWEAKTKKITLLVHQKLFYILGAPIIFLLTVLYYIFLAIYILLNISLYKVSTNRYSSIHIYSYIFSIIYKYTVCLLILL